MQEKSNTYTYTARNVNEPDRVVTFTLFDGYIRVNLTGLIEQAHTVANSKEKPDELKRQVALQARPAMLKMREGLSGPLSISDVDSRLQADQLQVTMWPRVGGLRLAPVRFDMGQVDNPQAARAFVDELENRKETHADTRRFVGPLDYWIGWAGLAALLGLFIYRSKQRET